MSSDDPRKDYLAKVIMDHLVGGSDARTKLAKGADTYADLCNSGHMDTFLEQSAGDTPLQASLMHSGGQLEIKLFTEVKLGDAEAFVCFTKLGSAPISAENIQRTVQITPVPKSAIAGFYSSLHHVFLPLLKEGGKLDKSVDSLLSDLDASLGSLVRGSRGRDIDEHKVSGILKLEDEIAFCNDIRDTKKDYEQIRESLSKINKKFKVDDDEKSLSIEELFDDGEVETELDEMVRTHQYPETRMTHLLKLIGDTIIKFVQTSLASKGIWRASFLVAERELASCMELCNAWECLSGKLVQGWRDARQWRGDAFKDERMEALKRRFTKLKDLRKTQDAFATLLTADEEKALRINETFELFGDARALQVSAYSNVWWDNSISEYTVAMEPAMDKVFEKLRERFASSLLPGVTAAVQELKDRKSDVTKVRSAVAQPYQLLREFSKYKDLLQRPAIADKLKGERAKLATSLQQYLQIIDDIAKNLNSVMDTQQAPKNVSGKNLTPTANCIVFVSQLLHKVQKLQESADALVSDLKEGATFNTKAEELVETLTSQKRKHFEGWRREVKEALQDDEDEPVALQMKGKLMSFDKSGKLVVHYSERLVNLLREARQLCAINCQIPSDVEKQVNQAQKHYHCGTVLKQVAAFYNRIESEIIPSQMPMLLKEADEFEKVVQGGGKSITWGDDETKINKYQSDLKEKMDNLMRKNRRLRRAHEELAEITVRLMATDLVRQRDLWKEKLGEMKNVFKRIEDEGVVGLKNWRVHWDYQLFKALDFQYKVGLESCHETLPQMEVKLVFQGKKLVFKPPFEELKQNYYKELKKFINIPVNFKGVGETDIFGGIIDRNAGGLAVVFQQAEKLFKKLSDFADSQAHWVALGTILQSTVDDLDQFVEEQMTNVDDFEFNFRMLSTRERDASKLPDEKKIDCITVDATGVKETTHNLLRKFQAALRDALRKSAQNDIEDLEKFVEESLEALSIMPQTVDDIAKATQKCALIAEQSSEKKDLKYSMEEKCRLVKMQRGDAPDYTALSRAWDDLELRLSAHEKEREEQKEKLRGMVDGQIKVFRSDITKFASRWKSTKPDTTSFKSRESASDALANLTELETEWGSIKQRAEQFKRDCRSFDMPEPQFTELESIQEDVEKTVSAWALYHEYNKEMSELTKDVWIEVRDRMYVLEDCLAKWAETLKGRDVDVVVKHLHTEIERLKKNVPYLKFVKGEGFTQEHWATLFMLLKFPKGTELKSATLQLYLDKSDIVVAELAKFKDLQARAVAEMTIREAFDEISKWGINATFTLLEHKDCRGKVVPLIKEWKDVLTQVGDHQSVLQAMRDSPYFQKFGAEAEDWDRKLSTLGIGLNDLNSVQRKWLYLEPIFGRGALPQEQSRFKRVDDDFRSTMFEINSDSRVVSFADIARVCEKLSTMIDQLDRCQKALSDFLEQKRSKFPRFYFVGDDDLLEILGQSQNPAVIQSHLKKLFQAIFKVEFSEDMKTITAFQSLEGERVDLLSPVEITETVEEWLANLATQMVKTLEQALRNCLREDKMMLEKYPSMILCACQQIRFCQETDDAIDKGPRALQSLEEGVRSDLAGLTSLELENKPVETLKLKAIILDVIHNVDVCQQLRDNQVKSRSDWYWHKQLRFYVKPDTEKCFIKMADAENAYTYEYQGNDPKLVHTPLTDKCFLTLTQALHLGYGGNPYGPAGTGKTESVKALGQALARQVLVFNCDEGIDFKSMGRIFTGLVKCGAWGCFDEFNRLEPEVLSAVSQQIQTIQAALKERRSELNLLGMKIEVNPNSGIFVTLNPAGKGYGGRSELPDNLKQLFRSVAMAAPDNALIGEVILYAEGYKHAKIVGTKVVELFTLSRQLLTKQQHYDWGLRALKTILLISGKLIQMEKKANGAGINLKTEMELVIKAVRLNTLAKLTYSDTVRFEALIKDIFPGSVVEDAVYKDLEDAIELSLERLKLDLLPSQVKKVVQLNENLNQRMGCVIVGPSGCGKSTLLKILKEAQANLGQSIVVHTMNPKAMQRQQLLGHMDLDTREWFDGVLTASARKVVKEPPEVRSWIICDGDIDPEWVESLNSVLDDNRLLTMPSGERIRFGPNVNFIFETNDLRFASPATVSRMGMIFLSDEDMQTSCLLKAWVNKQPEQLQANLSLWLEEMFDKSLKWVLGQRSKSSVVETTKVGIVLNALSHLVGSSCKEQFVVSLIRGLGSNMPDGTRSKLAAEIFQLANERPVNMDAPLETFFDLESKTLKAYAAVTDQELGAEDMQMTSPTERDLPIIKTKDVLKNTDLFNIWLLHNEPFLLVGPEGCGKSMLLRYAFRSLKNAEVTIINCNAQTMAIHVIQKLQQFCTVATSQSGRVYRPKSDKLILYLKDINLPKPDKYATMQLIAFLQQLILYKGFYDGLEWMEIERVQIVCSMNPSTTVGRNSLTTRFTAIMRIASISYPDRDQLQSVYSSYLKAVVSTRLPGHPTWSDRKNIDRLAGTLLDLYANMQENFKVDDYRHYLFTPRDITAVVIGCLRYDLQTYHVLDVLTYEAERVFRDRLVGDDAMRLFDGSVWGNLLRSTWNHKLDLKDSYFTTWLTDSSASEIKMLGKANCADLTQYIQRELEIYARENSELDMLLFAEIVQRIARLDRILSEPGGSALMIGRPGVGRRTCSTIACFMKKNREGSPMQIFSPNIGRDYGSKHFMEDLKKAVQAAGVIGNHCALYLEDYQLADAAFLEIVNSLLSSGEVPGMFTSQELDALLHPLKEEFSNQGFKYKTLYSFFVSRVQKNLHIILSLDPTHPDFAMRCESNPALFSRCTILWLEAWSKEGMLQVPKMRLSETLKSVPNPEIMVQNIYMLHDSMAPYKVAPRQYCTLLESIGKLYEDKKSDLDKQRNFLRGGLTKLDETWATVDTLSREAMEQEKVLQDKQHQAKEKMKEITVNMEDAGRKKSEAEELSKKLKIDEAAMQERKAVVDDQLAECIPVLEAAKKAVSGIKKDNLNEIRSLKLPPEPIRDVLEGVLRLMNNQDTSWISMKRFLSQPSVITEIMDFDAKSITPEMREGVKNLLVSKRASFDDATIARVSMAAAPMAAWVKAQIQYSLVLQTIKPLTDELDKLNKNLEVGTKRKEQCLHDIRQSDEIVAQLQDEHQKLTDEAADLRSELKKTKDTLTAAESLLGKLKDEKERWGNQMKDMDLQMERLPMTLLMASSFITYLGIMPEDTRLEMTSLWCRRLELPEFRFMLMMSSETERLEWKAQGLPGDDLSAENSIIITKSTLYPLIIDPSTQASKWLSTYLAAQKCPVELTTQQDAKFIQKLELSVRFGKTLVIQEVDRLEPLIIPLLRRDLIKQGARHVVHIGDKLVDFSEQFKLYLVTRNPNIDIPPDVKPLVSAVNFSVTRSGLEGQLLGVTIRHEKPKLEQEKSALLEKEESMKVSLSKLEKDLLEQLASSTGNILEDNRLIQKLSEIKASSIEIKDALKTSSLLQQKLNEEREVYRDFARTGSNVFFLIQSLKSLNPMYQFDLPTYLGLFKTTLQTSQSTGDVDGRMRMLEVDLKRNVFQVTARSLFKADRLTFATHLVRGIRPETVGEDEWKFFVGLVIADSSSVGGRMPEWVPPDRGPALQRLMATMPGLTQQLKLEDKDTWCDWLASRTPEDRTAFPSKASNLTDFQRILVVQALRPDRVQTALESFSLTQLGTKSLNLQGLDFQQLSKDSSPRTPIMFIITPGADPSAVLEEAANKVLGSGRYQQLAMGQGQSEAALAMLNEGAEKGWWVCLQNVHLVVGWLPVIEKTLHSLQPEDNFRLWLTTEEHPRFPPILLQQSLKVTFEAPPGMKMNLSNAYDMWDETYITRRPKGGGDSTARAQLLFIVAWFHGIVQERRTFIPQGWSKFHEFSLADLRSTADIISSIENPDDPPWLTLHGLLDNAIYGGRIDNEFDQRILRTCLETFYASANVPLGGRSARIIPYTNALGKNSGGILVPEGRTKRDFTAIIATLPDVDTPALFGLPPNIERVVQQRNSVKITGQLKTMATADVASAGWERERMSKQLQPILQLWQTITSSNSALKPVNHGMVVENAAPVDAFVAMESEAALQLVNMAAAALSSADRVLKGSDLLTAGVKAITSSLAAGKVPDQWDATWEGPDSPAMWLQAVVKKKLAIDEWLAAVRSGATLERPVSLSNMFNPQVFLNALRQQTSRNSQPPVAVDDLKLVCLWGETASRLGTLPCALAGLSLQGAVFTAGATLSDARSDTPTVVPLPTCIIAYIPKDVKDPQEDANSVVLPVYEGLDRSKLLAKLRMPCRSGEQSKWIMAGVAIFVAAD